MSSVTRKLEMPDTQEVKVAIGLDIGHGETAAAFVALRNPDGSRVARSAIKTITLQIMNNTPKVYSSILYAGDTVSIGSKDVKAVAYFKCSPGRWNEACPGAEGRTYRAVMGDFIRETVSGLLDPAVNPDIKQYKAGDIALYVGCPADPTWTDEENRSAYEQLIRESTGIGNVMVVAESTAAIFSAVRGGHQLDINPSKGVVVLDLGSSTADFTYVQLGKILMELSWTLGASEIERLMMAKALAGKGEEIGDDDFEEKHIRDIEERKLEMRAHKEAWYGDRVSKGYCLTDPDGKEVSVQYYERDEFGNIVPRKKKDGTVVPKQDHIDFDLDQAFMGQVIRDMPVRVTVQEKGMPVPTDETMGGSWYGYCKAFFVRCRGMIRKYALPCSVIVISGGASKMPFVKELAAEVFGDAVAIHCDETPSYSVCTGLCQIALNHDLIVQEMQGWQEKARDAGRRELERYRDMVSDALTEYIFRLICDAVNSLPDETKMIELQNTVTRLIGDKLECDLPELLEGARAALEEASSAVVQETAAEAGRLLYAQDALQYSLSGALIAQRVQMGAVNISGGDVINGEYLRSAIENVVLGTIDMLGRLILLPFAILSALPLIGKLFEKIVDWGVSGINQLVNDPNKQIKKDATLEKLHHPEVQATIKENIKCKVAPKLADVILTGQFGEEHADYDAWLEKAVADAVCMIALEDFGQTIYE